MSVKNEFSKHANEYNSHNIIQQIAAKSLIRELESKPSTILELGCGSGQIFKHINWNIDHYTAIDFASNMCELHPKGENIDVLCMSFDDEKFFEFLKGQKFDCVLSASALQWSKDLKRVINALSEVSGEFHAVLFTSNTFKTIQKLSEQSSPILSAESIKEAFEASAYDCEYETYNYNLEFDDKRSLFDYIKRSGVSGGAELDFKRAKKLYKAYDLNYLEFEVIFIKARIN